MLIIILWLSEWYTPKRNENISLDSIEKICGVDDILEFITEEGGINNG